MSQSYWGYLLILLGVLIIGGIILVYNYTSKNESDYYLLKETTEAAMLDAAKVNNSNKNNRDELSIDKEKFVENFIRRFSQTNNLGREYEINFYDISESPPMVTVEVKTTTDAGIFDINIPIVNRIDGILEVKEKKDDGA